MPGLTPPTGVGGWAAVIAAIFAGLNMLMVTWLTYRHGPAVNNLVQKATGFLQKNQAMALSTVPRDGIAGALPPPFLPLSALPVWGQLAAPLPDGNMDPEEYNDCGETCVSMVVAAVHGVPVPPGAVRAALGGVARTGLTTAEDLVQALAYYHVQAHVEAPQPARLKARLAQLTQAAQPSIILGTWPTPGPLHWLLVYAIDQYTMRYINPWGANRSWLNWDSAQAAYAGSLVVVDAHAHYDMSKVATPI